MKIHLKKLTEEDSEELFQFELKNRHFFEQMIPGRGDDYYQYESFSDNQRVLLQEQTDEKCFFYLVKNNQADIIGRVNIIDLDVEGTVSIGYRIGESFTGQGIAKEAVRLVIEKAMDIPEIKTIIGKTTTNHLSSQRVLERNGFILEPETNQDTYTNSLGETYDFVQFRLDLQKL